MCVLVSGFGATGNEKRKKGWWGVQKRGSKSGSGEGG